jgi:hypothetical protein
MKAILVSIALISLAMHFPHFSKDLISIHVWRQAQTQSTIVNFYEGDMNIFNPARNDRGNGDGVFRMEFPLMQWLVAATYKVFGNHLIITRIWMFVIGLFSVAGMYVLLSSIFKNKLLAVIGAWAFNFSPSFYYYTINPIPDNLALCCSIWGLALFFTWLNKNRIYLLWLSGLLLSAGALCKLPFILYFIAPLAWFLIPVFRGGFTRRSLTPMLSVLVWILLPMAWYVWVIPGWDATGILRGVRSNEIPFETVLSYLWFNLVSTLPELLLNYGSLPFFLAGFFFLVRNNAFKKPVFPLLMLVGTGIIAYFLYEVNMIARVHDYYLFPFLPLLFMLVAYGAFHMIKQPRRSIRYLAIFLLLILPITAWLRMQVRWNEDSPGFNKDLLSYKNELRQAVPGDALCIAGNDDSHYIFFYYIDKKGWVFEKDNLPAAELGKMIGMGARYLYSDSRTIDGNEAVAVHFDELVAEKGSIRVYRLKKSTFEK